jgi:hypothetical protein
MRTALLSMAIVLAGLLVLLALESSPAPKQDVSVTTIARRVEALRGLRFTKLPEPVEVSAETARREGLEDLDRSYPAARRHADEAILRRLGLIDRGVDLRNVSASLYGEGGVAGYYDPRSKRLRIVTGAATGTRVLQEVTLAHELTHALEDQRFGLSPEEGSNDDRALARLALIEGSATLVMERYLLRHFSAAEAFAGVLGSAFATGPDLPPFLQAQLLFPYTGGMTFVQELVRRAGGRWTLVDLADRVRPPDSTEQVLHPGKYLRVEEPLPVGLDVRLGAGWKRAAAGVWGEWATSELVGEQAAAGWGGDRYELWQGPAGNVLAMRWRWDTPRDAREFAAAARSRLRAAELAATGDTVTLVWAPTPALAASAARSAGRGTASRR